MQPSLAHPVTRKWPAQFRTGCSCTPLPTPNGIKMSVMLEEVGIPYEAHRVNIHANEQFSPEFLALNPNNKIPAILDPHGPGGIRWRCSNPGRHPDPIWPKNLASCCRWTRCSATKPCSG